MAAAASVVADASSAAALLRYRPGEVQTSKTRHSGMFCGLSGATPLDHGRAESAMEKTCLFSQCVDFFALEIANFRSPAGASLGSEGS